MSTRGDVCEGLCLLSSDTKKRVPIEMIGTCWCVTVLVVAVLVIWAK